MTDMGAVKRFLNVNMSVLAILMVSVGFCIH